MMRDAIIKWQNYANKLKVNAYLSFYEYFFFFLIQKTL